MDFEQQPQESQEEEKKETKVIEYSGEEMLKVCAWCDQENGVRHEGNVTHGMCEKHAQAAKEEMKEWLENK
jgi:hypothetical protein